MPEISVTYSYTDNIPIRDWGPDHWSTLAYMETVMVDLGGGFQIGSDARMRSNRRNYRVMSEECPRPKRAKNTGSQAISMKPEHGSVLRDGTYVPRHDDWCCVQDMACEGLLTMLGRGGEELGTGQDTIEPGNFIRLTERGEAIVEKLRRFKAAGGRWAAFEVEDSEVAS